MSRLREVAAPGVHLGALLLVASLASPVAAQESVFNLGGFGLPASGESVRARALGGAGLALPGESFSLENPASMARFSRAGFYLSLVGQATRIEDAETSDDFDDVWFPLGQVVVPAWERYAIGGGYVQAVDFDGDLVGTVAVESDSADVRLTAEGALSVIAPAAAIRLDPATTVGVSLDVYLGSRTTVRSVDIRGDEEDGGSVASAADTLGRDFRAVGFTLGAERLFGERLRLSAAYRFRPDISSQITEAPGEELEGLETDIPLPDEVFAGASVALGRGLVGALAVRYAGWDGFDAIGVDSTRTTDAFDVGGGIEWSPARRTLLLLGPSAPLRAGARWRRLPLELEGEPVREWAATIGYGWIFNERSRLDVALEAGRRGGVESNGLTEEFVRVGVGLAVFEPWRRVD